ncbi:MAG TPA: Rid family detoxifying hydrolase [Erysipelothrix sp.]|nr:Rid family detoxifying hydrolase [Erysipelothrix sp.]
MKTLNIKGAPSAIGPYSHATIAGDFLFVSGQLGINPENGTLLEGVEAQTVQALANLKTIVEGASFKVNQIVKATIYLKNMDDFQIVNKIYGEFMGNHKPARVAIGVKQLPMDADVEIDAIVHQG